MAFDSKCDKRAEVLIPVESLNQCIAAADYICQTIATFRDRTSDFFGDSELGRKAREAEKLAQVIADEIRSRIC